MSTWPYGNHQQMVDVCQIPEDILNTLSTEELIDTVLAYPLFGDIYAYDNTKSGYLVLKNQFNGLIELCRRNDKNTCLSVYIKNNINKIAFEFINKDSISEFEDYKIKAWMFSNILINSGDFEVESQNIITSVQEVAPVAFAGEIERIETDNQAWISTPKNYLMKGIECTVKEKWLYSDNNYRWRSLNDLSTEAKNYINQLFISLYGISPVSSPTVKYNCHSYAWYQQTSPFWWVYEFNSTGYNSVGMQSVNNGGKIVYYNSFGDNIVSINDYTHSAIIQSKIYHQYHVNTVISFNLISKWGLSGLYQHTMENCPYYYAPDTTYICDRMYYNS